MNRRSILKSVFLAPFAFLFGKVIADDVEPENPFKNYSKDWPTSLRKFREERNQKLDSLIYDNTPMARGRWIRSCTGQWYYCRIVDGCLYIDGQRAPTDLPYFLGLSIPGL